MNDNFIRLKLACEEIKTCFSIENLETLSVDLKPVILYGVTNGEIDNIWDIDSPPKSHGCTIHKYCNTTHDCTTDSILSGYQMKFDKDIFYKYVLIETRANGIFRIWTESFDDTFNNILSVYNIIPVNNVLINDDSHEELKFSSSIIPSTIEELKNHIQQGNDVRFEYSSFHVIDIEKNGHMSFDIQNMCDMIIEYISFDDHNGYSSEEFYYGLVSLWKYIKAEIYFIEHKMPIYNDIEI